MSFATRFPNIGTFDPKLLKDIQFLGIQMEREQEECEECGKLMESASLNFQMLYGGGKTVKTFPFSIQETSDYGPLKHCCGIIETGNFHVINYSNLTESFRRPASWDYLSADPIVRAAFFSLPPQRQKQLAVEMLDALAEGGEQFPEDPNDEDEYYDGTYGVLLTLPTPMAPWTSLTHWVVWAAGLKTAPGMYVRSRHGDYPIWVFIHRHSVASGSWGVPKWEENI